MVYPILSYSEFTYWYCCMKRVLSYPGSSLKRTTIGPFFPITNSLKRSPPVVYSISIFCLVPFLWIAFNES